MIKDFVCDCEIRFYPEQRNKMILFPCQKEMFRHQARQNEAELRAVGKEIHGWFQRIFRR